MGGDLVLDIDGGEMISVILLLVIIRCGYPPYPPPPAVHGLSGTNKGVDRDQAHVMS